MSLAQGKVATPNQRIADMSVAGPAAGWILAASPVLGTICIPHEGRAITPKLINQWFSGVSDCGFRLVSMLWQFI